MAGSIQCRCVLVGVHTTRIGDGKRLTRTELQLRALRMGAKAIPPIEVTWRLADGTSGSFETPRRLVRVRGRLDNERDPALGEAPEPVEVIATNWLLVTLATLLGGALLALVQQKDPTLAHTGLRKVQAAAVDDASIEWVSEAGAARFRAEGRRALLSAVVSPSS